MASDRIRNFFKNAIKRYHDTINDSYILNEVDDSLIRDLWYGNIKFEDLYQVTGYEEYSPVSKEDNMESFARIFFGNENYGRYLTFEILQNGYIQWYNTIPEVNKQIEYRRNKSEWITCDCGTTINVQMNDILEFRGSHSSYMDIESDEACYFTSNCRFNVKGNIMSLIYSDDFMFKDTLTDEDCFTSLFYNCDKLISAENLIFPATTLTNYCYFNMFRGCTSLTTAPTLPAATLANYCYAHMFYECTSLNYIKCLATDISAQNCLDDWVNNVASSGTFIKASDMEDWPTGINGIPDGWNIENIDE